MKKSIDLWARDALKHEAEIRRDESERLGRNRPVQGCLLRSEGNQGFNEVV